MARSSRNSSIVAEPGHRFGGNWTETKLAVLEKYIQAYTKALQNKSFKKIYIDGFAGSGSRSLAEKGTESHPSLFPDSPEIREFADGSAKRALRVRPAFDRYLFIEQNRERCAELEALKEAFPEVGDRIEVRRGDANAEICKLCDEDWHGRRAVLFLDPYGMAVDWATVSKVAATKAIDVWILLPLGQALTRVLTRTGKMYPGWEEAIDRFLGTEEWRNELYPATGQASMFEPEDQQRARVSVDKLAEYLNRRLKGVFPAVAAKPAILRNSKQTPIFLFSFAVSNPEPKAVGLALKIANHILKGLG